MLTILAYHRILPNPLSHFAFDNDVISVTPAEFAREIGYLRRHFNVISMQDYVKAMTDNGPLPPRPALVTFDDGYRDNYDTAFPILKEQGVSACFFLTTQFVGTQAIPWWDQVACCMKFSSALQFPSPFCAEDPPYQLTPEARAASTRRFLNCMKERPWHKSVEYLEYLRSHTGVDPQTYATTPLFMSWKEAAEMQQQGMVLGGHTRTHPILGQLSDDAVVRNEIQGCYRDILDRTGEAPSTFAYPVGKQTAMSVQADNAIVAAGFQLSFSFVNSYVRLVPHRCWRIPRIHASFGDDYQAFRIELMKCRN